MTTKKKKEITLTLAELLEFKRSPKHYDSYLQDTEKQNETKLADNFSLAVHDFFRDKDSFHDKYKCLKDAMLPAVDKTGNRTYRLKENRIYRDVEFPKLCVGKTVIPEYQYDMIMDACGANYFNDDIRRLFGDDQGFFTEATEKRKTTYLLYTEVDNKTGMILSSMVDTIPEEGKALFDFKITDSAVPHTFTKQLFNQSLHNKASWHLNNLKRQDYVIFAIEKTSPWVCQPFILDPELLVKSHQENRMFMDILYWTKIRCLVPSYAQLNIMKTLYQESNCYILDLEETMNVIDQFQDHEGNTGFINVEVPFYMK